MMNKQCAAISVLHAYCLDEAERDIKKHREENQKNNPDAIIKVAANPDLKDIHFDGHKEHTFTVALYIIKKWELRESVIEVLQKHNGKSLMADEVADDINFSGINFDSDVKEILDHLVREGIVHYNFKTIGYTLIK